MRKSVMNARCYAVSALLIAAVWCFSSKTATAQSRNFDIERFQPALDDSGFISLDGRRVATMAKSPGERPISLDTAWMARVMAASATAWRAIGSTATT